GVQRFVGTKDGTEDFSPGNCVYLSAVELKDKRMEQGAWSCNCQMLMRPQGDATQGFKRKSTTGPPPTRPRLHRAGIHSIPGFPTRRHARRPEPYLQRERNLDCTGRKPISREPSARSTCHLPTCPPTATARP